MLLESIFPTLPQDNMTVVMIVIGLAGAALITYSQFLEALKRRDLVRLVGAFALFLYALWDNANIIFMLAMAGLFSASLIEFLEILAGIHRERDTDSVTYKRQSLKR